MPATTEELDINNDAEVAAADAAVERMLREADLKPQMSYEEAYERLVAVGFNKNAASHWAHLNSDTGADEPPGGY